MTTHNRIGLLRHQTRFDLLVFIRNPAATFFTAILPIIFLVLFTALFGNQEMDNGVRVATLYVPGILALAIISATAVNVAFAMTTRRERGVLKRVRGTPMPPPVFVAAQAIAGFTISLVMTVLIIVIGRVVFDVSLIVDGIPTLLITLLIGATSFSVIGLAITTIIPSEEAAPAVTNAIMLPLYFISDVFIAGDQVPGWIQAIANIFPVRHLSHALQESFDPTVTATPWPVDHWLVIGAWGAVATVVTLTRFEWTPRR